MSDHLSRRKFVKLAGAGLAAVGLSDTVLPAGRAAASAAKITPHSPLADGSGGTPDAQMQKVLDNLAALEFPPFPTLTPFNARQGSPLTLAVQAVLSEQGLPCLEAVGDITHMLIPGPGGQLLIRVYTPRGSGPFPGVVYFHGGGWVIANLDTYDPSCRALCNAANAVVVSVAYRQAPENRFPAAPLDAYAATQWVMANAAKINVDPAKVAVAGESAGGNLATVVTLMARDTGAKMPVHQLLVYPITNYAFNTPSYEENAMAKPLDRPTMQWFFSKYLRSPQDGNSPHVSPLRANLRGLPPATVITAEIDPLRDEGEAYADRLKQAGVPTTATRYNGVTHEFFSMSGILDKGKQAVAEAAAELKKSFGT